MSWIKEVNAKLVKHRKKYKKSGLTDSKLASAAAVSASWRADTRGERIKKIKKGQKDVYNFYYILRSPGNDLLDFYDKENEKLGKDNRAYSAIPPSLVYHYRFEYEYPEFKRGANRPGRNSYLKNKLKHIYDTHDLTYYGQVYKGRHAWLKNEKSKEWKFDSQRELNEKLSEVTGQKSTAVNQNLRPHLGRKTKMFWRGKAAGWSIIAKEYEKEKDDE